MILLGKKVSLLEGSIMNYFGNDKHIISVVIHVIPMLACSFFVVLGWSRDMIRVFKLLNITSFFSTSRIGAGASWIAMRWKFAGRRAG